MRKVLLLFSMLFVVSSSADSVEGKVSCKSKKGLRRPENLRIVSAARKPWPPSPRCPGASDLFLKKVWIRQQK